MRIIDGKLVSEEMYNTLRPRIQSLKDINITPGIGVIIVGDKVESKTYVNMKKKRCEDLGIMFHLQEYPFGVLQKQLEDQVNNFNADPNIHGILIQLPLPDHIDKDALFEKISIKKDVDAFHPYNAGLLSKNANPLFIPCTPRGCMTLLDFYDINVSGKNITVIGASNLVGLPLSLLLLHRGATVTVCHILTNDIKSMTKNADIVFACCGSAHLVKKDWVKSEAIIVDVGINKVDCSDSKKGYKLVGDVDFENIKDDASYITPVPGGVGPMTIASLVAQIVESAERTVDVQV
jgi:5,10-methylene-tetrahydrofolate dehydrogenase/methenyl tetrahydrofolate cyclohydrolase